MGLGECITLLLLGISIIATSTATLRNTEDIDNLFEEASYLLTLIEELEKRTDQLDRIQQRREE